MESIPLGTDVKILDNIRNQYHLVQKQIPLLEEKIKYHQRYIEDIKGGVFDSTSSKQHADSKNKCSQDNDEVKTEGKHEDSEIKKEQYYGTLVKQFVESSTLHGFSSLVDSLVWVRIIWFCALAGAIFLLSVQISVLTRDYLSFGVITDVGLKQGEVAFPAITVCNNRRFLASRLKTLPIFSNSSLDVNGQVNTTLLKGVLSDRYNKLSPDDLSRLGASVSDSIAVYTFPVDVFFDSTCKKNETCVFNDQTVQSCQFNRAEVIPNINRKLNVTVTRESRVEAIPYYGSCYSVNPPADTTYMVIALNLHIDDSIDTLDVINEVEAGMTVFMKDSPKSHPAYEPVYSVEIKPGKDVWNEISHDVISRLNGSYGQCQDNENSFLHETGIEYEEQTCLYECEFQTIISKCRCLSREKKYFPFWLQYTLKIKSSLPICKLESDGNCISRVLRKEAKCACKPSCHVKLYKSKTLRSFVFRDDMECSIPGDGVHCGLIHKWIPDNATSTWIKRNIAGYRVWLSQKPYSTYVQKPGYPLLRFLADDGGTMGFYLGASMLTYFELVHLSISTVLYLKDVMRRKWRKNSKGHEGV